MTDAERIDWIDGATVYSLLYKNRFEPPGSPWFTGDVGKHLVHRLSVLRDADPGAYVAASKDMGWGR